jgi:hypothetical protein
VLSLDTRVSMQMRRLAIAVSLIAVMASVPLLHSLKAIHSAALASAR